MARITGSAARFIGEYIAQGYWEPWLTADDWDERAKNCPEKEAIIDRDSRLSWADIKLRSDRLAMHFLGLGIKRDEVVVSQLPNISDFIVLRLALAKAGILNCQPATTLRFQEMSYILERTRAVCVVIPWEIRGFNYFNMIEQLRPRLPFLKYIILAGKEKPAGTLSLTELYEQEPEPGYAPEHLTRARYAFDEITHIAATSGTTGTPKLVNQSDAAIKLSAKDTIKRVEMTESDTLAIFAPLSGGAANVLACYCAPLCGAKIVLSEIFEPARLSEIIAYEKPSILCSVPTVLVRMLNDPGIKNIDVHSIRAIFYYGAPIAYQTAREVERTFGCALISRYGAFDIAPISCTSLSDTPEVRLSTAGKPYSGCEIRLYDEDSGEVPQGREGEIWVKGPTVTHGFYQDEEATDRVWNVPGREGWGCTGDRGRFDEAGNLVMVGRKAGAIIRGGQNINPREVEDILRTNEKVADVAIVGMPDREMGERVCAFVVAKPAMTIQLVEIVSFFKEKLIASFKIPERIELMDSLPLVSGQKIDYQKLTRYIEEKLRQEGSI